MANDKYIIGLFDHEDKLIKAIRSFRKEGIEISNTLTPFPLHGLEDELGYDESRLHTAGFMFGATGMALALFIMTWVSVSNYPINIGGKPLFALPAFIPITFELTVLFAAVGMVMVYLKRNNLFPGNVPRIYDDRITDDRFALLFEVNDNTTQSEYDAIANILNDSNVTEIKTKEFSDDDEMFSSIERDFTYANNSTSTSAVVEQTENVLSEDDYKSQLLSVIGEASADNKDDLKKIKGIGKVFESKLNELGIYTFDQIAKLDSNAVSAVEALSGFPGRVERENWIGQANILKSGGDTEFSERVEDGEVY